MRFMAIVKATEDSEAGKLPSTERVSENFTPELRAQEERLMARIEKGTSR